MKNKALWQKILYGVDFACTIAAFVFIMIAVRMESPIQALGFNPWLGFMIVMGVHFAIHGVLNWKEHRWTAIFDFVLMALVLVLGVPKFLK